MAYMLYTMKFAYKFGGVTTPIYKGEDEVSGNFEDHVPLDDVEDRLKYKAEILVQRKCAFNGTVEITKLDLNGR